MGEHIAIALLL